MKTKEKFNKGITLVALVITIIILLILSGITIATLGGENGLFSKTKQAKKAHIQSEMQEQLTLALNELQVDKKGNASLDDVTQDWINTVISKDYNPQIKEDASFEGKMVVMNKNDVTGKFLVNQNLEISKAEYNVSTLEFEYETEKMENGKVKILIKITDKVNGLKQIDYPGPNEDPLIMENRKTPLGIDYYVELGKEYKFVITTGDGNKTEKTIKIDDYYYNVTKDLGESAVIDNNKTKVAYNKTYEATITTEGNYAVTGLTVTMGGQIVTTAGDNVVDITTGKIKIEKVTGDIDIKVTTKKLEIQYTAIAVSTSNSASNTSSLEANTQPKGTPLYINIIATLEGNSCTIVSKTDNSKTVPYQVTTNGKYTFKVSGTYSGKTISEDKDVTVNQYMSAQNVVQYDAGNWTKEEIEELKSQNLYMINKDKVVNGIFNLNNKDTGLNFTFGGFTYDGDIGNQSYIDNGVIITSRNQSVSPQGGYGVPQYDGWQILESKQIGEKTYVTKIVHSGSPENFACQMTDGYDAYRAEYLLTGKLNYGDEYKILADGKAEINIRNWDKYKDKKLDKKGYIKEVRMMKYDEVNNTTGGMGAVYWLPSTKSSYEMYAAGPKGEIFNAHWTSGYYCFGIRPVIVLNEGVYISSGTGTWGDPYIFEKD